YLKKLICVFTIRCFNHR
ncbi:hypothetical protein CP061683_1103B, partial [Chlamydia psittaci 06-1683]